MVHGCGRFFCIKCGASILLIELAAKCCVSLGLNFIVLLNIVLNFGTSLGGTFPLSFSHWSTSWSNNTKPIWVLNWLWNWVTLQWGKCLLHLQKRLQLSEACLSLQCFLSPGAQAVTSPHTVICFRSSSAKMLLLYADYSVLNLCMCQDARSPDVISEVYFEGSLDGVHFLSALKDHLLPWLHQINLYCSVLQLGFQSWSCWSAVIWKGN